MKLAREALQDLIREAATAPRGPSTSGTAKLLWAYFRPLLLQAIGGMVSHPSYLDTVLEVERSVWRNMDRKRELWDVVPEAFACQLQQCAQEIMDQMESDLKAFEIRRLNVADVVSRILQDVLGSGDLDFVRSLEDDVWEQVWRNRSAGMTIEALAEKTARETAEIALLLIRRKAGDLNALEELHIRFAEHIRHVIKNILRRREDQEDAEQDAWTRIFQLRLDPWRAATLRTYLKAVAISAAYDCWRKARRYILETDLQEDATDPSKLEKLAGFVKQSPYAAFNEFLRFVFGGNIPPHQALAYGFRTLLGMTPREIEDAYGEIPLRDLVRQFLTDYSAGVIPGRELKTICGRTLDAMDMRLGDVISNINTRETYEYMLDRNCGLTCFRDYDTGRLPARLTRWIQDVSRHLERQRARTNEQRLRVAFDGQCPPYEAITYCRKTVAGVSVYGIIEADSSKTLFDLSTEIVKFYKQSTGVGESLLRDCFNNLHNILREKLDNVLDNEQPLHREARKTYAHLLPKILGEICLADFELNELRKNISHWIGSVNRAWVGEEEFAEDAPLR